MKASSEYHVKKDLKVTVLHASKNLAESISAELTSHGARRKDDDNGFRILAPMNCNGEVKLSSIFVFQKEPMQIKWDERYVTIKIH